VWSVQNLLYAPSAMRTPMALANNPAVHCFSSTALFANGSVSCDTVSGRDAEENKSGDSHERGSEMRGVKAHVVLAHVEAPLKEDAPGVCAAEVCMRA
jgi:hypothetical protein